MPFFKQRWAFPSNTKFWWGSCFKHERVHDSVILDAYKESPRFNAVTIMQKTQHQILCTKKILNINKQHSMPIVNQLKVVQEIRLMFTKVFSFVFPLMMQGGRVIKNIIIRPSSFIFYASSLQQYDWFKWKAWVSDSQWLSINAGIGGLEVREASLWPQAPWFETEQHSGGLHGSSA